MAHLRVRVPAGTAARLRVRARVGTAAHHRVRGRVGQAVRRPVGLEAPRRARPPRLVLPNPVRPNQVRPGRRSVPSNTGFPPAINARPGDNRPAPLGSLARPVAEGAAEESAIAALPSVRAAV